MEGCILFKYHGLIDVSDSCIITSEQLFKLTRAKNIVPDELMTRLKYHPTVVFGTSILLTQVQQVLQTVLREAFAAEQGTRYVVPRQRGRLLRSESEGWMHRIEESISDSVRKEISRLGLTEIGGGQREFVRSMIASFEAESDFGRP